MEKKSKYDLGAISEPRRSGQCGLPTLDRGAFRDPL